ncbi:serine O-acetyltransferase [Gilliamella apicola]|uniref:serine O-acetyltransferase n=1 Tax=Gilliamella sp. wkB308 TaxID=3120263 RepID=UPI0009BF48ED
MVEADRLWHTIRQEASQLVESEPMLASYFHATLLNHKNLGSALSYILANKLVTQVMPAIEIREIARQAYEADTTIIQSAVTDILAVYVRDPATNYYSTPLLYYKGFLSLQAYRIAHWLWKQNRKSLAIFLQSQIAIVFGVDIHPAAQIGCGVMFDHATGIVIGETVVIENDVSILQSVTLGGTGKENGDRHPKIREGVMIGAHSTILGNIEIGKGAKIGAGSVVLEPVPEHTTVAGVPAKVVGCPDCEKPALNMNQDILYEKEVVSISVDIDRRKN